MRTRQEILFFVLVAFLLLAVGAAFAQSGFELTWWTVDGGGGRSTGDEYTLVGTIGQADAGSASGGNFTLLGGFEAGLDVNGAVTPPGDRFVYLPFITR